MNWIDLIICLLSLIAVADGWRRGLISRAFALAGLIVGIYGASLWGERCAEVLGIGGEWSGVLGFVTVLAVVVVIFGIVGKTVRKVCGGIGLGMLDGAGGALLSLAEVLLLAGLLLRGADRLDPELIPGSVRSTSKLYGPLMACCDRILPEIGRRLPEMSAKDRTRSDGRPNAEEDHE